MLNGTMDPQTTISSAMPAKEHFTKAHQNFITMPGCAHGVIFQSNMKDSTQITCGMNLMEQFVKNPEAALDQSCLNGLETDNFEGFPTVVNKYWPIKDLYENKAPTNNPAPPSHTVSISERNRPFSSWPWQTALSPW
jgi:hypothetical protein